MPIYEYACKKCGEFEQMQKITDAPLKRCPTCHGKVTKLISNTSFQLKGSGWYVTDYGRKDSNSNKKKDSGGEKAEGSSQSAESKEKDKKSSPSKPVESAAA